MLKLDCYEFKSWCFPKKLRIKKNKRTEQMKFTWKDRIKVFIKYLNFDFILHSLCNFFFSSLWTFTTTAILTSDIFILNFRWQEDKTEKGNRKNNNTLEQWKKQQREGRERKKIWKSQNKLLCSLSSSNWSANLREGKQVWQSQSSQNVKKESFGISKVSLRKKNFHFRQDERRR